MLTCVSMQIEQYSDCRDAIKCVVLDHVSISDTQERVMLWKINPVEYRSFAAGYRYGLLSKRAWPDFAGDAPGESYEQWLLEEPGDSSRSEFIRGYEQGCFDVWWPL